jgi:hypothetical protein
LEGFVNGGLDDCWLGRRGELLLRSIEAINFSITPWAKRCVKLLGRHCPPQLFAR